MRGACVRVCVGGSCFRTLAVILVSFFFFYAAVELEHRSWFINLIICRRFDHYRSFLTEEDCFPYRHICSHFRGSRKNLMPSSALSPASHLSRNSTAQNTLMTGLL